MFTTLEVSREGAIGRLWLSRPDKLNTLSPPLLAELAQAAQWFDEQDDLRVVVVGGRGRVFSAGADLACFEAGTESEARETAGLGRAAVDALENMRALTVARLHGWCVGGGLVLAAACDLRVAASTTRFSIPEIDLGIPLTWGGIPRLVREIGPALTRELVLTCRPFEAGEALQSGFLSRVVDAGQLDDTVEELARTIAAKPCGPVRATKEQVNAVTARMVGLAEAPSDMDALLNAMGDAECRAARQRYLDEKTGGEKSC